MLEFDPEKHQYKDGGLILPSVTQVIQGAGLNDLSWVDKDLLEQKADLGRKVHSTTELYDRGELDLESLHPMLNAYLQSWIKFKKDAKFEVTETEIMLSHKLYRFAGRLDRAGLMGKDITLLDIKSGVESKSHAIQTAAYELLFNQDKKKNEQIKRRMTVYLSPEGYKVRPHTNQNDGKVFLAALTIYNYLHGGKK